LAFWECEVFAAEELRDRLDHRSLRGLASVCRWLKQLPSGGGLNPRVGNQQVILNVLTFPLEHRRVVWFRVIGLRLETSAIAAKTRGVLSTRSGFPETSEMIWLASTPRTSSSACVAIRDIRGIE
jgi:hypothetical protein